MLESKHQQNLKFVIGAALALFLIGLARVWHSPYALDIDGAEQMYLSQWLELGFGIQPPLPTWVLWVITGVFGHSSATVLLTRLLAIFFIYVGMFRLSFKMLKSESIALSCTLSLVLILQFSSEMLRQMHTVFVTLSVIYSWLALLSIYSQDKLKSYIWLGFWLGFGLLSKYNFALHLGLLALVSFSLPDFRKRVASPKLLVTIFLAIAICLPHYSWLYSNFNAVFTGVNSDLATSAENSALESLVDGLGEFMVSLISFTGILTGVFFIFFYRLSRSTNVNNAEIKFVSRYVALALIALLLIVIISKANVFHEHWLQPFFLVFPFLLFAMLPTSIVPIASRLKAFNALCISVFVLISINFAFKSGIRVITGNSNSVFNVPYYKIASAIEISKIDTPGSIILTRDVRTAGHLKLLFPERLILVEHDAHHLKLEEDRVLRSLNSVFVWKVTGVQDKIPINRKLIQNAMGKDIVIEIGKKETKTLNYTFTHDQPYSIGIAKISIRRGQ